MVDRLLRRKMPNSWQRWGRSIPNPKLLRSTTSSGCWTNPGTSVTAPCWRRSDFHRISSPMVQICPLCTHGTAWDLAHLRVPPALEAFGFRNVHEVASQAIPDGDFPTVASPNPEEGPALAEAVALAEKVGASLVMGTDPDSDRVGLAVPDGKGSFVFVERQRDSGAFDRPRPVQVAKSQASWTVRRLWPKPSSTPTCLQIW